jgi:hypothetical protein
VVLRFKKKEKKKRTGALGLLAKSNTAQHDYL